MAQIHSFYITNAKSELKYSSSDLTDNELDTTIQEITAAMVENDDLFVFGEEEDEDDQNEEEDESSSLNNDILYMENIIDLDLIGFE